jgi:hypothetical protein
MEASFFATMEALARVQPKLRSGAVDLLRPFDANRDCIYGIAARICARAQGSYDLVATDI